ncbi:MAG: hypothetical protein WC325_13850, partial [Candidatus Bathyarchaeia archaeon]
MADAFYGIIQWAQQGFKQGINKEADKAAVEAFSGATKQEMANMMFGGKAPNEKIKQYAEEQGKKNAEALVKQMTTHDIETDTWAGRARKQSWEQATGWEKSLASKQDIEKAPKLFQSVVGAVESTPYTLSAAFLGPVGFATNLAVSVQNNVEQKVEEAKQSGKEPDYRTILQYSTTSGLFEQSVESLLGVGIGKGVKTAAQLLKISGKQTAKTAFKLVAKEYLKAGAGEALEEYVQGFGSAVIAKLTTDPNKSIISLRDEIGSITSLESLSRNAFGALIIGGLSETMEIGGKYQNWKATRAVIKSMEAKPVDDITDADLTKAEDAIHTDAKQEGAMDEVWQNEVELMENIYNKAQAEAQAEQPAPSNLFADYVPRTMLEAPTSVSSVQGGVT